MGPALIVPRRGRWAARVAPVVAVAVLGCGDDTSSGAGGAGGGTSGEGGARPGVDPFCATRPVLEFCEDFDEAALPGRFTEQRAEGATLALDETDPASPPHALRVTADGGPATGIVAGAFEAGSRYRLFFQLRIDALPAEGEATIGAHAIDASGTSYRVGFGVDASGAPFLDEVLGDEVTRTEGTAPLPLGRWVSVRLDVDLLGDGTGTATLRFGNDIVATTDALAPPADEAAPSVSLGLVTTGGTWVARFDNVTIEVDG